MATIDPSEVTAVVAAVGDKMTCPGCGETVTLDWADGWRNDNGFTCEPVNTTHGQHIETIRSDR